LTCFIPIPERSHRNAVCASLLLCHQVIEAEWVWRAVMFTGSCLCGGVRFSVKGELQPLQLCHCAQCPKAQGSAFASALPINVNHISLVERKTGL
jgi:hypothetical protein